MTDKIESFIKKMKNKGVLLEVDGQFVKVSPPDKMSMSEVLEMQKLNKNNQLSNHLSKK